MVAVTMHLLLPASTMETLCLGDNDETTVILSQYSNQMGPMSRTWPGPRHTFMKLFRNFKPGS